MSRVMSCTATFSWLLIASCAIAMKVYDSSSSGSEEDCKCNKSDGNQ